MPGHRRFSEGHVVAEYVALLCQLLEARGIARDRLLAGTGASPADLADPAGRVPHTVFQRIVHRAIELTGDQSLGLQLGLSMNIKTHGFLGYAAMSSRTLADAIDLAVRYHRTRTTALDLQFFVEGDTAVLQFDERLPLGDLLPFAIDSMIASFYVIRTQLIRGPVPQGEARVTYAEQPHHKRLRELLGDVLRFNCAFNQIRFPAAELAQKLDFSDPQLVRMAAAQCEEELKKLRDESGLLGEVRRRVLRRLAEDPSLERIADELHMAPRTLRRRLSELGTSYHGIVEQLRRGLAVEYLQTGNRSVEEIATALGYSDPSNFGRAFRRWTGVSPSVWRERNASA
ncbi:MAG: AraC family transcriptional regulator [Pseudomonadota bacterium]